MRKVLVKAVDGSEREINIRPMTRREVKSLKKYGYTAFGHTGDLERMVKSGQDLDDIMEAPLKLVLSSEDIVFLDDCDNAEFKKVWTEVNKETFFDEGAEKNSKTSSNGNSTKTG